MNNNKILALIPARGGSKGIPRKNIIDFCGKPLIAWTINTAKKSKFISDIVVSTDDEEIANISIKFGVSVCKRPEYLASDTSLVFDTVKYTLDYLEDNEKKYEYIVLLEPTAPQRTSEMIDDCIEVMKNKNYDSIATFSELNPPPGRIWRIKENNPSVFIKGHNPWARRQEQEKGYFLNGAVYAVSVKALRNSNGPAILCGNMGGVITSGIDCDIDTIEDLRRVEYMMMKKMEKK